MNIWSRGATMASLLFIIIDTMTTDELHAYWLLCIINTQMEVENESGWK